MIYLASPYSDPNPNIMQLRYDLVCEACAGLAKMTLVVYSPIAHWHPIATKYNLPKSHHFWRSHNYTMIRLCDQFLILTIDGWEASEGIKDDKKYALGKEKLIRYISLKECK
jgi:hypothetical protein